MPVVGRVVRDLIHWLRSSVAISGSTTVSSVVNIPGTKWIIFSVWEEKMSETWIFSFGVGQALAGYYVELRGSQEETRKIVHELFGNQWSFQYPRDKGLN